jgi:2-polyprenyl-3-methyl-5-hydroxy-6-metoxy-1,4-benzoquinol methylase
MMHMPSLATRRQQPEIMDQPGLENAEHQEALRGLARINTISGSAGILWRALRPLAKEKSGRPLRVLDVATGGGDLPIRLALRAQRAGLALSFAGVDISPTAIAHARKQAAHRGADVDFFPLDVLGAPLPAAYDVITSSLFLHHLEAAQGVELLRRMGQAARLAVFINDLVRSRLGWWLALAATRLLTTSAIVHVDGPRSVEAAFTMAEARQLAEKAGLENACVRWRWPFRFLLEWRRPP